MFPALVFASHFQILIVRKPDTRPECFTTHRVAPYRYISFVYTTQYVTTHKTRYMVARNRNFGPYVSVLTLCTAVTLLHAQPTHSPELVLATKSVKRNGTALALAGRAAILFLTTSVRKNCYRYFVYFADILQLNSMTCNSFIQKMQMNKSSIRFW
jgi:hypothetical protein